MNPTSEDILKAALELSEDERIVLAGELLESIGPENGTADWATSWQKEVARRWQELESGAVKAIPWTEVEQRLKQKLDQGRDA